MPSGKMAESAMSASAKTDQRNASNNSKQMSYDPTEYVQRARVTKAAPPKPAANPLQFVQIKPCNLYQSAQEQIKRAEEVKKVKEIVKEEPEDWQSNLDNWKSGRRKRVEHIIDRVVEAKKLEMEELDRNRKKSKTFSEMMEERESKGRKCSLPVYNDDDDTNDYNRFGFNLNDTISGKSSISEDYENHSVNSDNPLDGDKNRFIDNNSNETYRRNSISSPGFDDNTSNSTLSAASPDPIYASAFNANGSRNQSAFNVSVESWTEKHQNDVNYHEKPKARLTPKIEGHLANLKIKINDCDEDRHTNADKINLPKIDISSRRELFEKELTNQSIGDTRKSILINECTESSVSIKERLSYLEKRCDEKDVTIENGQFVKIEAKCPKIDVPVVPLKERLFNLECSMVNEHRSKKMNEPKPFGNREINQSPSVTLQLNECQRLKDDDSGINSDDLHSSLTSQQCQFQQITEPIQPNNIKMDDLYDNCESVAIVRKPEVLPRRQITPDLVKIASNIEDDLLQSQDEIDDEADNSVIDALDIALNAIDTEKPNELIHIATSFDEIYEEINEFKPLKATLSSPSEEKAVESVQSNESNEINENAESIDEPYYQVPKKQNESYYEVPKSRPIPVYENVDMYYDNKSSTQKFATARFPLPMEIGANVMQPPKEKPPPPPIDNEDSDGEDALPQDAMKRINSTKRIKKEIRNKRSSFLGIEGNDDESFLELNVAPPPNIATLLQEERRIEKQMYIKAGLCDSSDTAESRDSGVSENHSRQSSEPVTSSSEEQDADADADADIDVDVNTNQPEILNALEKDKKLLEAGKNALALECRALGTQQWVFNDGFTQNDDIDPILKALDERERARCIADQNSEEADILRVERELLQLEQEELKRQNMVNRKMYERIRPKQQEFEHRRSLQDINGTSNLYANVQQYTQINDHRKSMPNLQEMTLSDSNTEKLIPPIPPIPPAKPLRVQEYFKYGKQMYYNRNNNANQSMPMHLNNIHNQTNDECVTFGMANSVSSNNSINGSYSNMSRHTLHALSAAPKPKFQDTWTHNNYENTNDNGWHSNREYLDANGESYIRSRDNQIGDNWMSINKRRSDPQHFNYNNHWLIQEAEQRRLDQARRSNLHSNDYTFNSKIIPRKGSNDNKPLPEAVIQTLTQRVQHKLSDKKRLDNQQLHYHYHNHSHSSAFGSIEKLVSPQHHHNNYHQPHPLISPRLADEAPREILSVSGKKKCSYCCEELGRGAAMIIESLRLFYHLDCFKCCVCRVQLGDGISGADVRVRNQKLHCNNCFSSDDGVKFSCV